MGISLPESGALRNADPGFGLIARHWATYRELHP
jgi:hypothetical protein